MGVEQGSIKSGNINVKITDTLGNPVNPAQEDGNLAGIKTQTDKLTFTGNKLQVDAVIETGDIEIGAVEIKNATDDTRATVGANGLYVDVRNNQDTATTIIEYNVSMTLADTEYSQALPTGCKMFEFRNRGLYDTRYAFTTGKVAGSTAPYQTLRAGMSAHEDKLNLTGKTIYFACSQAAQTIEMIAYS